MSTHYLKLIPTDPECTPSPDVFDRAATVLERATSGSETEVKLHEHPVYIDAGEMLDVITCPNCGASIDASESESGEWFMDAIEGCETDAQQKIVAMPCCGIELSFAALTFSEGGIARFELATMDPETFDISTECLKELETLLGCQLKQINTTY